jgi:hypothetical protein
MLSDGPITECSIKALWGAGLVARRDALTLMFEIPGFPAVSGRLGTTLVSGEDLEMCAGLCCAGYRLVFSSALQFRHDLASDRFDPVYAKKLFAGFAAGFEFVGYYRSIADALERPLSTLILSFAKIAKHGLSWRLNRDSFVALVASCRLPLLLTRDQRRVYLIVQQLRNKRGRQMTPTRKFYALVENQLRFGTSKKRCLERES